MATNEDGEAENMRAVVIVTEETGKGTPRNGQEYISPLLTLTGTEYSKLPFPELHKRICDALRGGRPAVTLQMIGPDGEDAKVFFEDGTLQRVNPSET